MSLPMIIYLANVLNTFNIILIVGCIGLGIGVFICGVTMLCCVGETDKTSITIMSFAIKWIKILGSCLIVAAILTIIVPSQDTIYLMAGTSKMDQLADTPEADKARTAFNLGLDKIIKNLQDSK